MSNALTLHDVRVYPSKAKLAREDQLAWKMAEVAADPVALDDDVIDMIINRIIDNASVAIASAERARVPTLDELRLRAAQRGAREEAEARLAELERRAVT